MAERVGNVPDGGEMICANRGWQIFAVGNDHADWRMVKLISRVARKKSNFWLGWNGERLSKNSDAALLEQHHPDVFDWVVASLSAWSFKAAA